jgi:succinoglycan biosynthesis transport protein ExoP
MQHQLLKSAALANAELYNTLQGRLNEAGIYAGLRSSNIHIVDLAPKLISATGPHRVFIIMIGTLASWLFAVALAFVLESFENTIRTPDDITNWVGLPSLAMLPTIKRNGSRFRQQPFDRGLRNSQTSMQTLFLGHPPMAESEAIRGLRTSLLLTRTDTPPRVMLVSSALMGEGKTTVSVNLATAFAQRGRTCLLIDADLRRPRIAGIFGLNPTHGLSDILNGAVPIESALVAAPNVTGLTLLPSGRTDSDPTDLLGAERMRVLIDTVRYKFDFIVVDSPPVIPFSDARLLALVSEVVILVSRYGFTTRRALTIGAQLLGEVRAPVVGVVLNDIDVESPDYHYYYYGFSRGMTDFVLDSSTKPPKHVPVRPGEGAESSVKAGEAAPANPGSKEKSKGTHA